MDFWKCPKDFERIGKKASALILKNIRSKLLVSPQTVGKKLKGALAHLWSFRVGQYRVLYQVNHQELWVLVVHINHRKDVYH